MRIMEQYGTQTHYSDGKRHPLMTSHNRSLAIQCLTNALCRHLPTFVNIWQSPLFKTARKLSVSHLYLKLCIYVSTI